MMNTITETAKVRRAVAQVRVTRDTRRELRELGNKFETYDEIIRKLISSYRNTRQDIKEAIAEAEV